MEFYSIVLPCMLNLLWYGILGPINRIKTLCMKLKILQSLSQLIWIILILKVRDCYHHLAKEWLLLIIMDETVYFLTVNN